MGLRFNFLLIKKNGDSRSSTHVGSYMALINCKRNNMLVYIMGFNLFFWYKLTYRI